MNELRGMLIHNGIFAAARNNNIIQFTATWLKLENELMK